MKKKNNEVHLHGFINGIRINDVPNSDRKAVNLDVVTLERFRREKGGEYETKRTYHDVVVFTEKPGRFVDLVPAIEKNQANKGVEGFQPETHTVSLDGILQNREVPIKGSDKTYRTLQIIAKDDKVALDAKKEEKEVANTATIVGNIASIRKEDKFAVVSVINHYRPEEGKDFQTTVDVRVSGDRKFSKPMFDAIMADEVKVGDFVRVGGQLHNNNYEKDETKRFSVSLDLTGFQKLTKKEAETLDQGEAKAETKAQKKEAKQEVKPAPKAKAVSQKKAQKPAAKQAKAKAKKPALSA